MSVSASGVGLGLAVALALALSGCKDHPSPLPQPSKGTADDAGMGRTGNDGGKEKSPVGITADLEGSWRGELQHERYGRVHGDVVIDADGNVSYTVAGEGVTHSGVFRVLKWTGESLTVKDQGPAAGEYTIKAALSGPRLELQVPPIGKVVLVRTGAKKLEP